MASIKYYVVSLYDNCEEKSTCRAKSAKPMKRNNSFISKCLILWNVNTTKNAGEM